VLGEESGEGAGTSGVRWVLDPIDGTVNYLYGLPAWAVSVAAEVADESVVGVVHVPPTGEIFTAVRGRGAWLGDAPLRVNEPVPLESALIATGFGYDARRRAQQGAVLAALVGQVRDVRRGGSAAVDLCSVAAGRVDGYYERGTNRWDIAAGGLVATEAGACVEGLYGRAASPDLVLAAAPGLFPRLHDVLAALGADRDGEA
jgi:myo-inositol-1(or 4)-monophosphatase